MIDEEAPLPAAQVRTLQIIAFALISGLASFGLVMLAIGSDKLGAAPPNGGTPILSLISAALLVSSVPIGFVVAKNAEATAVMGMLEGKWEGDVPPPSTLVEKLLFARMTSLLIQLAMAEGPGLFGGVAFMTEGGWIGLAVLAAAAVAMASMFPTEARLRYWLSLQAEKIRESNV